MRRVLSISIFLLLGAVALADGEVVVSTMAGSVSVTRDGTTFMLHEGDHLHNSDRIVLEDKAILQLGIDGVHTWTLQGPQVYLLDTVYIQRDITRDRIIGVIDNELFTLSRQISINDEGESGFVTARPSGVRSTMNEQKEFALSMLRSLAEQYNNRQYQQVLSRIEKLNRRMFDPAQRRFLIFMQGATWYRVKRYDAALAVLLTVYNGTNRKGNSYNEDAHAMAMVCAWYLGNRNLTASLAEDYLHCCRKNGRYTQHVMELIETF